MANLAPKLPSTQNDVTSTDHFSKLPSEIKLAIFQHFSFIEWVAKISPTCSDWRRICTRSKVPKELIVKNFVDRFSGIRSSTLFQIAKNFQVSGIDLEGVPNELYSHSDCSWITIFAASPHLAWVNMKSLDEDIYNEDDIPLDPNTVSELSIESWDLIEEAQNAFPNITTLMVHSPINTSGIIREEVKFLQLKTLHTIARLMSVEAIKTFLTHLKESFAPNLDTVYLSIQNRKDVKELIEQYEALEAFAKSLNIKLYCRDLYLLVHDVHLFAKSFQLQDLPYSYYTYENKTLLSEAILAGSLLVVRLLLETKLTSIEKELGPYPLPNIFHRAIGSKPPSPPFLLPKHLTSNERTVVDYLLDHGLDVNRKVNDKLLFEDMQILHSPLARYLAKKRKVDWTTMTSDGYTVMHMIFEDDALELFKEIIRQTPDESSVRRLLHLRDKDGNTPLHYLGQYGRTQFIDTIAPFNPDWQTKNNYGDTPLLHWVKTSSADFLSEKFERIVSLVNHVQEGVLTAIFRTQKDPEALEKNITILATKGINFNEFIRGEPAVSHLRCFSAPLLKALTSYNIDIKVVNGMKRSLLYNVIESSDEANLFELLVKDYKLNINHIDSNGMTPLIFAIRMQKDEVIIRKLLDLGADPNLAGPNAPPALYYMRFHLDEIEEICELLLKAGADPNLRFMNEDKMTTSFMALVTSNPSEELLQLLIKYGGNVNERDEVGNTLLHIIDSKDQIKALLQYIDVNTTNDYGETPLWGKVSDISPFINKKANVNHVSLNGSTALHTAMQNKDEEKAHALLAVQNLDLSLLDNCGRSFLHFIHRCPIVFEDILNAYIRQSEENKRKVKLAVNNIDFFGKTAVHYVVKTASETLVRSLIQTFELNVAPLTDYTPLHQCVSSLDNNYQASLRIAKYLCELGVDVNAAIKSNNNTALLLLCAKHPHATEMKRILLSIISAFKCSSWMEKTSVFAVPELVTLIISNLVSSPQTIFDIARVSKWHNSLIWSAHLWKIFGINIQTDAKLEWFRIKLFFAEKEEARLKNRLEFIKKIKKSAEDINNFAKIVQKFLQEKEDNKLQQNLNQLTNECVSNRIFTVLKDKNIKYLAGSKTAVLKLIELLHWKKEIRRPAFAALLSIAQTEKHCEVIINATFVSKLVKRIGATSERYKNEQEMVKEALKNISEKPEGALLLLQAGAVKKLVTPEIFANLWCGLALRNILQNTLANNTKDFTPYFANFMELLIRELKQWSAAQKSAPALKLMINFLLVPRDANFADAIIKNNVVPLLLKVLKTCTSLDLIDDGIIFLERIVFHGTKQHYLCLIQLNIHNEIESHLDTRCNQMNFIFVDVALLSVTKLILQITKHNRGKQEINLLKLVIKKMQEAKPILRKFLAAAARLIEVQCKSLSESEQEDFVKEGFVDEIVTKLLDANGSSFVLECAIKSLNYFFKENKMDVKKQAAEKGIIIKLNIIKEKFGDNTKLQTALAECLNYFQPK